MNEGNDEKMKGRGNLQKQYKSPAPPQVGPYSLNGVLSKASSPPTWSLPNSNPVENLKKKNSNIAISADVVNLRNAHTIQKIQVNNAITAQQGFQNGDLRLEKYIPRNILPSVCTSELTRGLNTLNSGLISRVNPYTGTNSQYILNKLLRNNTMQEHTRHGLQKNVVPQKNAEKHVNDSNAPIFPPTRSSDDPSISSYVAQDSKMGEVEQSQSWKNPVIPGKTIVTETIESLNQNIKSSNSTEANASNLLNARRDSVQIENKNNEIDPNQSPPAGKWMCDKCKGALFDSYEEASKHEQTCQGPQVSLDQPVPKASLGQSGPTVTSLKQPTPKEGKIMRSLLPKDAIIIQLSSNGKNLTPEDIESLSAFHSMVLHNIEFFEDISKVTDLSPNERLPVAKGSKLFRAASVGGIVGIRCLHCKNHKKSYTVYPSTVHHFCAQTEEDIFKHFTENCSQFPSEHVLELKKHYETRKNAPIDFVSFCTKFLNKAGIFDVTSETSRYLLDRSYKLNVSHGLIVLGSAKSYDVTIPQKESRDKLALLNITPKCVPLANTELSGMATTLSLLHKFTILQLELKENSMGLISIQCKHCKRQRDHLQAWKKAPSHVFSFGHSHLSSCKSLPQDLSNYLLAVKRMKKDSSGCTIGKYLSEVARIYNLVEVIGEGVRFHDSTTYDQFISRRKTMQSMTVPPAPVNTTIQKPPIPKTVTPQPPLQPQPSQSPPKAPVKIYVKPSDPGLPLVDHRLKLREDLSDYNRYNLKHFDIALLRGANKLCIRCIYCRRQYVSLEKLADLSTTINSASQHIHSCKNCPKYITYSATISRIKKGEKGTQSMAAYLASLIRYYDLVDDNDQRGVIFGNESKSVVSIVKDLGLESPSQSVAFGRSAIPLLDGATIPFARQLDPFFRLSFNYLELIEINERKCLGVRCANCKIYSLPIRSFHFMKDAITQVPDRHLRECLDTPYHVREKLRELREWEKTQTYMSLRKFADTLIDHFNLIQLTDLASNSGGGVAFGGISMTMQRRKECLMFGQQPSEKISAPFYDARVLNASNISQFNSIALQQVELFEIDEKNKKVGIRCKHCHAAGDNFYKILSSVDSLHKSAFDIIYEHIFSCIHLPLQVGVDLKTLHKKQVVKCRRGIRTLCGEIARIFDLQNFVDEDGNTGVKFKKISYASHKQKTETEIPMDYRKDDNTTVLGVPFHHDREVAKYLIKETFEDIHTRVGEEYQVSVFPDASKKIYGSNSEEW